MKAKFLLTTALAAIWIAPASATVVGVTFEGVSDGAHIDEFYNGGTDSHFESGPGLPAPNIGVQFGGSARAAVDSDAGGNPFSSVNRFDNAPSPDTVMYYSPTNGLDPNSGTGLVNFYNYDDPDAGFETGISFFYSQNKRGRGETPGQSEVSVWSGLHGTGTRLATLTLFSNWTPDSCGSSSPAPHSGAVSALSGGGAPSDEFCNWTLARLAFDGVARSITFTGAAGRILIDNLTLGSLQPVPLPAAFWLLSSGLLGFAAVRRRRQAAA